MTQPALPFFEDHKDSDNNDAKRSAESQISLSPKRTKTVTPPSSQQKSSERDDVADSRQTRDANILSSITAIVAETKLISDMTQLKSCIKTASDKAKELGKKSVSTMEPSIADVLQIVESVCFVVGKIPFLGSVEIVGLVCKILRHFVTPKAAQNDAKKKLSKITEAVNEQTQDQLESLTAGHFDHMITDINILQHFLGEIVNKRCDESYKEVRKIIANNISGNFLTDGDRFLARLWVYIEKSNRKDNPKRSVQLLSYYTMLACIRTMKLFLSTALYHLVNNKIMCSLSSKILNEHTQKVATNLKQRCIGYRPVPNCDKEQDWDKVNQYLYENFDYFEEIEGFCKSMGYMFEGRTVQFEIPAMFTTKPEDYKLPHSTEPHHMLLICRTLDKEKKKYELRANVANKDASKKSDNSFRRFENNPEYDNDSEFSLYSFALGDFVGIKRRRENKKGKNYVKKWSYLAHDKDTKVLKCDNSYLNIGHVDTTRTIIPGDNELRGNWVETKEMGYQ